MNPLQALTRYAQLNDLVLDEVVPRRVAHVIDLTKKGQFKGIESGRQTILAERSPKRSGFKIAPSSLDNETYTFDSSHPKNHARHQAFRTHLQTLSKYSPDFKAILAYTEQEPSLDVRDALKETPGTIAFRVGGKFPYDSPKLREYLRGAEGEPTHTCRISGEPCVPGLFPSQKNLYPPGSKATLLTYNQTSALFAGHTNITCYPLARWVREAIATSLDHIAEYDRHQNLVAKRTAFIQNGDDGNKPTKSNGNELRPQMLFFSLASAGFSLEDFMVVLRGPLYDKDNPLDGKERYQAHEKALESLQAWGALTDDLCVLTLKTTEGGSRAAILDWQEIPLSEVAARLQAFRDRTKAFPIEYWAQRGQSYNDYWQFIMAVLQGKPMPPSLRRLALRRPMQSDLLFQAIPAMEGPQQ